MIEPTFSMVAWMKLKFVSRKKGRESFRASRRLLFFQAGGSIELEYHGKNSTNDNVYTPVSSSSSLATLVTGKRVEDFDPSLKITADEAAALGISFIVYNWAFAGRQKTFDLFPN